MTYKQSKMLFGTNSFTLILSRILCHTSDWWSYLNLFAFILPNRSMWNQVLVRKRSSSWDYAITFLFTECHKEMDRKKNGESLNDANFVEQSQFNWNLKGSHMNMYGQFAAICTSRWKYVWHGKFVLWLTTEWMNWTELNRSQTECT